MAGTGGNLRRHITFAGVLSGMAHVTTVIAFGSAILAFIFPEKASEAVARMLREIEAANANLTALQDDTARTADATGLLAASIADRPRFSARLQRTGFGDQRQFQLRLENLTPRSVERVRILYFDAEARGVTSRKIHVIPPFESMIEVSTEEVRAVCLNYRLTAPDGEVLIVTEFRRLDPALAPTIDPMGNAGTTDLNVTAYAIVQEPSDDSITCGDRVFGPGEFREPG